MNVLLGPLRGKIESRRSFEENNVVDEKLTRMVLLHMYRLGQRDCIEGWGSHDDRQSSPDGTVGNSFSMGHVGYKQTNPLIVI